MIDFGTGREGACVWAMLGETRVFTNDEGGGEHAVEMLSLTRGAAS